VRGSGAGSAWVAITVFAIAFAFVEAACAISLKLLYYPEGWKAPFHALPAGAQIVEQTREVATLVMIGAVAALGRPSWRAGVARALWIFGIWDLGYYVFLRWLTGFPSSLLDPDLVFLVPIVWVFPVWVPVLVSIVALLVALRLRAPARRR
jgi:hypothetical protein